MQVRKMRMTVDQALVLVAVRVRLTAWIVRFMRMLVVFVVGVRVFVF